MPRTTFFHSLFLDFGLKKKWFKHSVFFKGGPVVTIASYEKMVKRPDADFFYISSLDLTHWCKKNMKLDSAIFDKIKLKGFFTH